jgi:serine phosphatase RsbU (regulator of sigma subunit)
VRAGGSAGPGGERNRLLRWLALGFGVLALGVLLARFTLPEWQPHRLPGRPFFAQRFADAAVRLDLRLGEGKPRMRLGTSTRAYRALDRPAADRLSPASSGVSVEVTQKARRGDEPPRDLRVIFAADGRPTSIEWRSFPFSSGAAPEADRLLLEKMAGLLLDPGEVAAPAPIGGLANQLGANREIQGGLGGYPNYLRLSSTYGTVSAIRRPDLPQTTSPTALELGAFSLVPFFTVLAVCGLFVYLLFERRLSVLNAAGLAAAALLVADWPRALDAGLGFLLPSGLAAAAVFLLWSIAESLTRSVDPGATSGLDALRSGGLGRRAGRSLLVGLAWGAALAGGGLILYAAAALLPGAAPDSPPFSLPPFPPGRNLVADAVIFAAWALLAVAVPARFLPPKWAWPAALLLLLPGFYGPFDLSPLALDVAANLAFAGALIYVARRFGLTALLAASLGFLLLPAAAFALLYLRWMPAAGPVLLALVGLVLGAGLRGLSRAAEIEEAKVRKPAFVRRIEEERRAEYELDLLARMQLGLLPRELPRVAGYAFAAQSFLATEAGGDLYDFHSDADGGLWIAAGDVSGHGYSCAIAQAMTKAALASLIPSRRSPAAVLGRLHEVLKKGGPGRSFTTLTLLRLQPETGEAVLANAGHPAAFLAGDLAGGDEVAGLAVPGLPLGQGPHREYREIRFTLPPGGALLLYSDGLFEAPDAGGEIYGVEQVREILSLSHRRARDAAEVLDAVLAGWRRHRGEAPPADDTTLVVIRRAGGLDVSQSA